MSFHIANILSAVVEQQERCWVIALIVNTEGHCYRKSGALMFVNELGQYHGMVSGGCLEADIVRQARRVFGDGRNRLLHYDFSEDSEEAWQYGLGCGGKLSILLSLVNAELQDCFNEAQAMMDKGLATKLHFERQSLLACEGKREVPKFVFQPDLVRLDTSSHDGGDSLPAKGGGNVDEINFSGYREKQIQQDLANHSIDNSLNPKAWLSVSFHPPVHLLVVGTGPDTVPLWHLAKALAWRVTLVDESISARSRQSLPDAKFFALAPQNMREFLAKQRFDGAVIMTHNVIRDGRFLSVLSECELPYLAMLGPKSRTEKVMAEAEPPIRMKQALYNPAGLDLGGELPESIALAILAECHAILHAGSGQSIRTKLQLQSDVGVSALV